MKIKPPMSTLDRARVVAARWAALELEADQLCDKLAEEHRPTGYAGVCLRSDWGTNRLPAGELLQKAIAWAERHQQAQYSMPVEDGWTL